MFNVKILMKETDQEILFENCTKISTTNGAKTNVLDTDNILNNNFEYQDKTICFISDNQSLRINGNDILLIITYKMK
nr:MAG TPA: hypothetical protein [Caudoviricetes sp.]